MKKIIMIIACILTLSNINAQENNYSYLLNKSGNKSFNTNHYGALTFQYLNVKSNLIPGLEYGMLLNKNLSLGLYAQGTTGNFGHTYNGIVNNVVFHEEGISVMYISKPDESLHFGGMLKIGYTSLVSNDTEIDIFESFTPKLKDHGMVFHPEFYSELNFTKNIKVRLGGGYSFFMLDGENIICNKSLESFTLNLGLLFGNFSK